MKTLKITTVVLALIAAAAFTTSANAAYVPTFSNGDLVLGLYDSANSTPNSLETNLGTLASLTNGETWILGSDISTVFSASTLSNLVWAVSGSGGTVGAQAGNPKLQIELSAPTTTVLSADSAGNAQEAGFINAQNTTGLLKSANGVAGTTNNSFVILNSTPGSFKGEVNNLGGYGLGSNVSGPLVTPYTTGTIADFYSTPNGGPVSLLGTFQFNTTTGTLTFNTPVAVPEPSAYALGLCAIVLLWVLKRRNSVA